MKKLVRFTIALAALAIFAAGVQTKSAHLRPLAGGKTGDVIVVTG